MTPNKLPPLPEWMDRFMTPPDSFDGSGDVSLKERLHAYAAEALRQSQSLPAGAVDGPVFYVGRVYDCDAGEDRGEIHQTLPANLIGKRVRLVPVEQALQADAREKGEALNIAPPQSEPDRPYDNTGDDTGPWDQSKCVWPNCCCDQPSKGCGPEKE